ncbi:MAG: hypothetical protein ABL901_01140 [Hyphomicrobiaceae bacterium]
MSQSALKSRPDTSKRMSDADIARARKLLDSGMTQRAFANALGYNISSIQTRFSPKKEAAAPLVLELDPAQKKQLIAAAARYNREPTELATSILSIVIADDLFAAVIG